MEIRKVNKKDMNEIINLLDDSLSSFKPNLEEYENIWTSFSGQDNVFSIVAIINSKVVGYGSLVVETKIRGGKMGHIEDIVTHPEYRGKNIGRTIVLELVNIAKNQNCYKVSLQCKEHNVLFYEKCNLNISGVAMQHFIN
jgi:glucosamine-phosphate N-acetyltransferase